MRRMEKRKGKVYLLECQIETESKDSLEIISVASMRRGVDLLNSKQFEIFRFGPFKEEVYAFRFLGNRYRFSLNGVFAYTKTESCLIDNSPRAFKKIEYLLYYPASKQIKPITDLGGIITKYYPYGPDY